MNTERIRQIEKHGKQLQAIFPATAAMDPLELCKKLHRIEGEAHRNAEALCNYMEQDEYDRQQERIRQRLAKLLGSHDIPVFLNGDPRGYALKIEDEYMRENEIQLYRDFGGYGIIAPEF